MTTVSDFPPYQETVHTTLIVSKAANYRLLPYTVNLNSLLLAQNTVNLTANLINT